MRVRPPSPPLSDDVVTLRSWTNDDVGDIAAACNDAEIVRWLDDVPAPYTRADAKAYVTATRRGWREGSLWAFAITDAANGAVLGSCGVSWQDEPHGVAEIGYWVRPEGRRRGVATRAVRLVSRWVFAECGVRRLQLRADALNTPSQRVAERAGFTREGVLRSVRYSPRRGSRVDFVLYSLLPGELDGAGARELS